MLCSKAWLWLVFGYWCWIPSTGIWLFVEIYSCFVFESCQRKKCLFFFSVKNVCLPVLGEIGSDNVSIQETREY